MVEQNSVNPITAIKNYFSGMSVSEQMSFFKETGLNFANVNLMDYNAAMKFCKSHNIDLSGVSLWATNPQSRKDAFIDGYIARIDKHNKKIAEKYAEYEARKNFADKVHAKYKEIKADIFSKNGVSNSSTFAELKKAGGVSSTDIDKLATHKKAKDDAKLDAKIALSTALEHTHRAVV